MMINLIFACSMALNLSLPIEEIVHPWAKEKKEVDNNIRLSGESYNDGKANRGYGLWIGGDSRTMNNSTIKYLGESIKSGTGVSFGFPSQ